MDCRVSLGTLTVMFCKYELFTNPELKLVALSGQIPYLLDPVKTGSKLQVGTFCAKMGFKHPTIKLR